MCFGLLLGVLGFLSQKVSFTTPKLPTYTPEKPMSETETSQPNEPAQKAQDPLLPDKRFVEDWTIISAILTKSNLSGLKLEDIIHNMNEQGAAVTAIEPILRTNLLENFLNSAKSLRQDLSEKDCGWDIAFHGTLASNLIPIATNGLKIPSEHGHRARFLFNWGPGIYCSQYGTYSYSFGHTWSDGIQQGSVCLDPEAKVSIFICAVLRGRPYTCHSRWVRKYEGLQEGYESHVCPSQNEWIVFDESRIIPLCVMWVKKSASDGWFWNHVFWNHVRVKPGCANKRWRRSTKKLIASPVEKEYLFQRGRKGGFCFMLSPEESSKLKEQINELGTKA